MKRIGLDDDYTRFLSRTYTLQVTFNLNDNERNLLERAARFRAGKSIVKAFESLDTIESILDSGRSARDIAVAWGVISEEGEFTE